MNKELNEATIKRVEKLWEEIDKSNILNEGSNIYSYDGYNNKVNKTDIIGTVVPQNSRWGITNGWKIIEVNMNNLKIRKLTPKECWRLMGFDDEDFEKASKVNSNTQLYKQAGNSIVVNVLEAILKNLLF
jgi:DNA (cytosine-5)-methyltransferase 1